MVSTSFQAYTSVVNSLAPDSAIRRATAAAGRSGIAPDRLLMGMFFTLWLLGMFIILAAAIAHLSAPEKKNGPSCNSCGKKERTGAGLRIGSVGNTLSAGIFPSSDLPAPPGCPRKSSAM